MKKIIIFGTKDSNKSFLYRKIQKHLSSEKKNLIKPIVNYTENIILIGNSQYKFIDALPFRFPNKEDDIVDKNISILSDNLISSSDIIFWVINIENEFSEDNFYLQRYLEKKRKKYIIVFLGSDISLKKKDDFLNNYQQQKILKKDTEIYFLSTLDDRKNQKEFSNFIVDQFNFRKKDFVENDEKNGIIDKKGSIKLTIFGPPNSGKSTLLNSLVQYERSVVSEIAGTTKEDVISWWSRNEVDFQLKDTEGIINEKRNNVDVLRDCQIAWVVIDATVSVTKHTLQIVNLSEKCEKAVVIILNKIDLLNEKEIEEKKKELRSRLKSFAFVPIISISARMKKNFHFLFKKLDEMIYQSNIKFSKSILSDQFNLILEKNPPSSIRGKHLKIYYGIHEKGFVHKFVIFSNNPNLVHFSYHRYIINSLRRNLNISSLPIKLFFKKS